ncbi:MAG: FecR domain-containing protein, partial [Leptospiraceae bacterium]|nr:FecR domain-containing protein [Leptospiraceae bacterium]
TGNKSFCDLQIISPKTEVTFRIKANSKLTFKHLNEKEQILLHKGKAVFSVNKQNGDFQYSTPAAVAGVRGTKFELSVDDNKSSSLKVIESKVSYKVRVKEIEALSDSNQKHPAIQKVKQFIDENELVLGEAETITIDKSKSDKILKVAKLEKIISNPSDKKLNKALDEIKTDELSQNLSQIKKEDLSKIEKISDKDLEESLEETKELEPVSESKLDKESIQKAVESRNNEIQDKLIKRLSETHNKRAQTIILNNGEKIRGIIGDTRHKDKYILITPNGTKEFSKNEVKNIEF